VKACFSSSRYGPRFATNSADVRTVSACAAATCQPNDVLLPGYRHLTDKHLFRVYSTDGWLSSKPAGSYYLALTARAA